MSHIWYDITFPQICKGVLEIFSSDSQIILWMTVSKRLLDWQAQSFNSKKLKALDPAFLERLARVKGRGALARSRARSPRRSPQGAKPLALAKRRMGRSTNSDLNGRNKCKQSSGLFLRGETLVGGLPMGARSASMTAQTNNSHQIPIYAQTIISKSHSNISNLFFNVPAEIEDI